jgi:putative transposase
MIKISYSGFRFPPEIVQHAIWLYIRFTPSFRDGEGLSQKHGRKCGFWSLVKVRK